MNGSLRCSFAQLFPLCGAIVVDVFQIHATFRQASMSPDRSKELDWSSALPRMKFSSRVESMEPR